LKAPIRIASEQKCPRTIHRLRIRVQKRIGAVGRFHATW